MAILIRRARHDKLAVLLRHRDFGMNFPFDGAFGAFRREFAVVYGNRNALGNRNGRASNS
jgi:hypothetical protein